MRRVLWIAPYLFYPLEAGGQFSIYPWAKELSHRSWRLLLLQYRSPRVELSRSLEGLSWAEEVITVEPRRFGSERELLRELILAQYSFFRLRNDVPRVYSELERVASKFLPDIILISHSYMGFLISFLRRLFAKSKILIDLHNLEWRAYQNALLSGAFVERCSSLINFIRLRKEENEAFSECDAIVFPSPLEGRYLRIFRKPTLWRPARFPEERILTREELLKNKDLLIATSLNSNVVCEELLCFLREAWPAYRSLLRGACFWIVGRYPPEWFKKEASKYEGVHITGWVDDIAPYVKRARVFIVPFKKTMGSLTKIVSAWSWGVPVITTPIVAKGLRCEAGKHLLIGKNNEELLRRCLEVAKVDTLALSLVDEALRMVREEYSLSGFVNGFERWVRELL